MKPSEAGLILEGQTDLSYAVLGAKLTEFPELVSSLNVAAKRVHAALYRQALQEVTDEDVIATLMAEASACLGYFMPNDDESVRERAAWRKADFDSKTTPVVLHPVLTSMVLEGLWAITQLNRWDAIRHRVSRNVARQLLDAATARPDTTGSGG